MALRGTWHKTLVYFALAEEDDYPTEERPLPEPEEELEDRYRERPNVRRLESRRRRRDEFDDIFADDSPPRRGGAGGGRSGSATTLRPVAGNGRAGDVTVHLVIPKSFNDAQQIADQFK